MAAEYDTMHRGRSSEMRSLLVPRIYIPRRTKVRRTDDEGLRPSLKRETGTKEDREGGNERVSPMPRDRRRTDDDSSENQQDRISS